MAGKDKRIPNPCPQEVSSLGGRNIKKYPTRVLNPSNGNSIHCVTQARNLCHPSSLYIPSVIRFCSLTQNVAHLSSHLSVSQLPPFLSKKHLSLTYRCLLIHLPASFLQCGEWNGEWSFQKAELLKNLQRSHFHRLQSKHPPLTIRPCTIWPWLSCPIPCPPFFISPTPYSFLTHLARPLAIFQFSIC